MSELKSKTHFRLESLDAHYFNSSSKTQSNQNYEFLARQNASTFVFNIWGCKIKLHWR